MGVFTREPDDVAARPREYSAIRTITASAQTLNFTNKSEVELMKKRRATASWQEEAWEYFDAIGEVKYAFRLFSNVVSRVRLYAGYVESEDAPPGSVKDSDLDDATKAIAARAMARVFGHGNQADILRKAAINLMVSGECYLVQMPYQYGVNDSEEWKILSVDQLVFAEGTVKVKNSRDQRPADMPELPTNAFTGRIWVEHARYSDEADSSMRALLEPCGELMLFSRAARATARSRLNAGALFIPDSLSVAGDQVTDAVIDGIPVEGVEEEDEFEKELMDSMTTPIADESSVASVVPLLIRGPREDGEKIKLIKFERSFDPQIAARAERALDRILQGIDLPKDLVSGLSGVKYSNAVRIEESLYTAHVEPLVLMLCDTFRKIYLEPALRAAGLDAETIEKIVVWYDPSAIMTAPDKSNAANVGHDKYALSNEAWRRANGFAETDAPSNDEIAQRLAIARGQLNEDVTNAILRTIMPDILDAARAQSIAQSPAPLPADAQKLLDGPRPPDNPGDAGPTPPPATPESPADPASGPPTGAGLPPIVD